VLEIGPGTGYGLASLARAASRSGLVCGLDISPRMLAVSARRLSAQAVSARALLLLGDAFCLPFGCDTFDAAFASFAIELYDPAEIPPFWRAFGLSCVPADDYALFR
jgi:ubiquinone/menaquinone biosynthesis C-methylase UbiE